MTQQKYLRIYLNDHFAGATVGYELAKRTYSNNQSGALGTFLRRLITELELDKSTLEEVMRAVVAKRDSVKAGAGWMAEKVGRLKLNGQLRGYSDLSRVVELEGLAIGIEGKLRLWASLDELNDPRLESIDLQTAKARARSQLDELEAHRLEAVRTALVSS